MQIQSIKTRDCFFYFGKQCVELITQRTPRDVIIRYFSTHISSECSPSPSQYFLPLLHEEPPYRGNLFQERAEVWRWQKILAGTWQQREHTCTVGEKMGENFGQIIYDNNCATVLFVTYFRRRKKIMCILFLQRYKVSNHNCKLTFFLKLKIETIKFVGKIYFALLPDFFLLFQETLGLKY